MIKTRIIFDVKDVEFFNKLKSYILLNYNNVIEYNEENYEYIISDKNIHKDNYIIISDIDFDIYKYQKASKICSLIINKTNIDNKNNNSSDLTKKISTLLSVTSACGGVGKTYLAQQLAQELAKKGYKVLYILLDSFSPLDGSFKDENEYDISKLVYYLLQKKDVNKAIEAVKTYDHIKDVHYIRCLYPSLDGFMKLETAQYFIKGINNNGIYDYIIFDIPSYLTKANIEIMKNSQISFFINKYNSEREKIFLTFLNKKMNAKCHEINKDYNFEKLLQSIKEVIHE